MTIKEFSHKHAEVFFWATIALVALFIISAFERMHGGRGGDMMRGGNRDGQRMMNSRNDANGPQGQQRQMMDPNNPNQPLINDTPNAAGTVETGAQADPSVPLMAQ